MGRHGLLVYNEKEHIESLIMDIENGVPPQDFSNEDTPNTSVLEGKKSSKKVKITMLGLHTETDFTKVSKTNAKMKQTSKKKLSSTMKEVEKNSESQNEKTDSDQFSKSIIHEVNIFTADFQCKICSSNFPNFEELAEHVEEK